MEKFTLTKHNTVVQDVMQGHLQKKLLKVIVNWRFYSFF